ncbi:MAG TPA: glycosyltransferase family 39 protein, partial [Vicinamibacteria bacterium]
STTPEAAKETLRFLSPRAAELAFLLLLAGIAASFAEIRESLPSRRLFYPVLVALLALAAVRLVPPRTHRIYYDEDIYQNVAQNIVWHGRAQMCNEGTIEAQSFQCDASEYNKEPNAFPFLLSLAFRLSGVREGAAHFLNHMVFALGAVSLFWLSSMIFGSALAGVGAALVYTLTPQNLLWGATVAAEPGAASFAALAVGAVVLFGRHPSWRTGLFAASALAFASQFRPESGLILGVAAAYLLLAARDLFRRPVLWGTALLTAVLLVPQLGHIWAVRHEKWGASEQKFSLASARMNIGPNVDYYVGGGDFPRLFTGLALLGLLVPPRRETISVLVWFALFFGIFIPFYAGSYRYGADVRFSLLSAAPLAALAGGGLGSLAGWLRSHGRSKWVAAAPFALVVYGASAYLPFTRAVGRESWASRADHAAALRMVAQVPEDGIVLTHNPGMIQVMGRSAAQTSIASYHPGRIDDFFRRFPGGVYFHYNFWCNVDDDVQNDFCRKVLASFKT